MIKPRMSLKGIYEQEPKRLIESRSSCLNDELKLVDIRKVLKEFKTRFRKEDGQFLDMEEISSRIMKT